MKMKFNTPNKAQPDPFIFENDGKLYLYVTAHNGVEAYSADSLDGEWTFEGIVLSIENATQFWAPSIIRIEDTFYIYVSCTIGSDFEHLHVAKSDNPLGPFTDAKKLFDKFSIDSHVVQTDAGLFLFYTEDIVDNSDKIGARILVDRLIDPYTPANLQKQIVHADFEEEIFLRNRLGDGRDWFTIEGPFWFQEGEYQYLMYSGGCFENDTYHIGYAVAKTTEQDLTKVEFVKHTNNGTFDPLIIKNDIEEGTGHNSVIQIDGQYYIVYHAREARCGIGHNNYSEERTGRYCKMYAKDGILTAELLY